MERSKTKQKERTRLAVIDLLAIASLWLASLAIVNPFGDFPLNDDWSFGLSVRHFLDHAEFRPVGWTAMPLLTHVLWGSMFCIPCGFSFDALRVSTLAMSSIGILGAYFLIRNINKSRKLAILVSLTIAFNPIYYALSNTFMTDVPFVATTILAALFLSRSLRNDSMEDLLLGTMLVVGATLNRQLGLTVAMAFSVAFILRHGFTRRAVVRAAIPPLLCVAALLALKQWLAATGRLPELYGLKSNALIHALARPETESLARFSGNAFKALLYLGLFLLPVLLPVFTYIWFGLKGKKARRTAMLVSASALLGLLGLVLFQQDPRLMPLLGNIVNPSGIGPFTLRGTGFSHAPNMAALPTGYWLGATALSLVGGTLLTVAAGITALRVFPVFSPGKMDDRQAVSTFLFLSTLIYLAPLLFLNFLDRYLLAALPLLAAGLASLPDNKRMHVGKPALAASVVLVGLSMVFSVCGTRDYLAWNRARWTLLNDLVEGGHVEASEIDGGFEFNGLHLYDPGYKPERYKSWWWVDQDTYVVAFKAFPGYSVVREREFHQWMPPHDTSVVLLKKNRRWRPPNRRTSN